MWNNTVPSWEETTFSFVLVILFYVYLIWYFCRSEYFVLLILYWWPFRFSKIFATIMYCIKVFLGFHDFLQNFLLLEKGGAQFNIHSQKYYLFPLTVFHLNADAAAKSLQLCPTLRDPMDCSPPGSSIHGIFQARVLEWVAIATWK